MGKGEINVGREAVTFSDSILADQSGLARGAGAGSEDDRSSALTPRADLEPGTLETVPLVFSGDHLLVQAELSDTAALKGALVDSNGRVVPGFEEEKSVTTRSHGSWYEVHWFTEPLRGKSLIMNNAEPPVALRLTLARGFLYAFRIVDTIQPAKVSREEPLRLSNHPQLFLDDHLVARMTNLVREIQQPEKNPANPLFTNELPWEAMYMQTSSVVYDDENDRFQAWYWASGGPDSGDLRICDGYAESNDGVQWTKPMIGREPVGPYTEHNLVLPPKLARSVFLDPDDPDPDRRYKGTFGSTSPDGITWTGDEADGKRWLAAVGKNDTLTSFVRWKSEYLNYVRYQGPETNTIVHDPRTGKTWQNAVFRCTGLSTSTDYRHWTTKELIFSADKRDGYPWAQSHALLVTAYGDLLIGLLPMMHTVPEDENNFLATMDVQLMVSRNGRNWDRVADRAVFMPFENARPIGERSWDHHFHPAANFIVKDDRVLIYYWGTNFRHGENRKNDSGIGALASPKQHLAVTDRTYGLGLATLPADRFVALHPASFTAEGVLETKAFKHPGGNLLINADLGASGAVGVEVLDPEGNLIPGFDRESSRLNARDPLRFEVAWKPQSSAAKTLRDIPKDRAIALRLIVINCRLYAFQLT